VIWPPSPIREQLNRLRQDFDPVSLEHAEAHITLTQPFKGPVTRGLMDQLVALLAREDSFAITYGPLRSWLPSPVLWLEVQPSERVLELRRKLHALGVFDLSLPHTEDFVPHMTITEGLSGPCVDDHLFNKLEGRVKVGSFKCTSVVYLRPDKQFRFRVEREIRLRDA